MERKEAPPFIILATSEKGLVRQEASEKQLMKFQRCQSSRQSMIEREILEKKNCRQGERSSQTAGLRQSRRL